MASFAAAAMSSEPSGSNGVTIAVSTVPNRACGVESAGAHGLQGYLAVPYSFAVCGALALALRAQASVASGLVATSVPSASVVISKSANTAGATSASCRRHSMASRRISTSACSLARIAMKCRQAR